MSVCFYQKTAGVWEDVTLVKGPCTSKKDICRILAGEVGTFHVKVAISKQIILQKSFFNRIVILAALRFAMSSLLHVCPFEVLVQVKI